MSSCSQERASAVVERTEAAAAAAQQAECWQILNFQVEDAIQGVRAL